MATSISCGVPCWLDDCDMSGQSPFRQYDVGTRATNVGTAAANQVASGVFPGLGDMKVTAATGLNLTVNAGYCCVANSSSSLQGGYIFGLMSAGTLTLTAADPSNPRIDLIVARVYDLGTSSSYSDVEIVTGSPATPPTVPSTPANSLVLAQIAVAATVTTITSSNITDMRSWVVAPGGILPIQNAAAAPAVPAYQLMYNIATGQLVQGSGSAGVTSALPVLKWVPQLSLVTASVKAASSGALTQIASLSVTTDGSTDIEIYTKWAYLLGSASYLTLTTYIDGTLVDTVTGVGQQYSGGSARYFTSSAQSNTPSAATHTIAWKFQAGGSGASTSDGVYAAATAAAMLRCAPVVT